MYFLNEGFLGKKSDLCVNFSGSDTRELFETQCILQNNWYYKDKEVTYKYNNHGHRCNNIEEIDFNNYILFTGCSHTEGIGNILEDTFPYLLSKKLNVDYYNFANGGTSVESQRHNLTVWLANCIDRPLPKYIIWQWSYGERFLQKHETENYFETVGPWFPDKNLQKLLVDTSLNRLFETRDRLISAYLKQLALQVPVIEIASAEINVSNLPITPLLYNEIDKGRDGIHFGRKTHKNIAELLELEISNNMLR